MSTSNHYTTSKWLKSNQVGYLESHISTDLLVATSRKWIEECTGCLKTDKNFTEYLQDGVVLCELVQCLLPGMIKKINRIRNPFAWRENISFFLGACLQLGLRDSQLFSPEDIVATPSSSFTRHRAPGSDKVLRRVALTISGLALELQSRHNYQGPYIQLGQQRQQPLKLSPRGSQSSISDQEEEPSPASLSSSFSSVQSLLGSKAARRVESVTSLITETSCTDIQSYAELVLYQNGSNKEYTCVGRPAPIRLTQSFNRASYSNKSQVHRTLSDCTPFTAVLPDLLQESVSDIDIPALQNGGTEFGGSRESFEEEYPEYRDYDSTTTPSDASTVIFRELLSSRCSSNLPVTGEECLVGGSYDNSPISSRHIVATAGEERTENSSEERTENSSPQIQRYSVDIARSDSKTTPVGFEGCGAVSPESDDKDIHSNTHENTKESLEVGDSVIPEVSDDPEGEENELTLNSIVSNLSSSTLNSNGTDFPDSTEQVTDIYASKLNHAPSPAEGTTVSEDSNLCGTGVSFDQSLERNKKMESYLHYQRSGGPVVDSEPIGMNGVRTHGYASNDGKTANNTTGSGTTSTTTPAVDVPHHSLTLALSDPESPSSYQVPSHSSSRHQNFDASSLASLENRTKLLVGDLDLSRVESDALPHSLLPSMIICENDETALPAMLADARSVDTCSTEDLDQLSGIGSPRSSSSPQHMEATTASARGGPRDREFSPGVSSMGRGEGSAFSGTSNSRRPLSAPNRSISAGAIGRNLRTSATLPSSSGTQLAGSSTDKRLVKKHKSLDVEQQMRTANIQEGARVALQYSEKRKNSRTETFHRDSRSTSLSRSIVSTSSDNDLTGSGNMYFRKSSSPAVTLPQHESCNSTASEATSTTPLNLRHLSIDQTKEASHTQMDEIWRQVEAIGDTPSQRVPSLLGPTLPLRTDIEDNRNAVLSLSLDPTESGMESDRSFDQEGRSEVLKESDIVISLLEPVDQSTPLRPPPQAEEATGGMSRAGLSADPSLLVPLRTENEGNRLNKRPPSFSNQDIDSLLDTLKSLSYNEDVEDLKMLEDMLKSNTFKKAKQAHDDMQMLLSGKPAPVMHRILPSTQLMRQHLLHHTEQSSEVEELRDLLRSPHVQAALFCHDKISSHDLYVPDTNFHRAAHDPVDIILSASIDNFQTTGRGKARSHYHVVSSRDVPFNRKEGATIVYLERTNRPLGCTIYKQEDSVFIGKLLKGCDAEASDMLREGDELLEVNGISVMGKRTDEIIRLMSGDVQPGTTLAFTIIPVHDESYDIDYEPKYMRAHFNYDGTLDDEIPCKALGLSFQKGDIMEIVNQDDPEWWQACKVFDENAFSLPGLMPSMHLQQQREALVHSYSYTNTSHDTKRGLKGIFSRKKKKKIYYQNTTPSNILGIGDEIPTYEQVTRLEPDPSLCRPIVLIGAPGVGRRTLIRKLMNSDPSLYHPVVQHTTRLVRPGEVNGHDYHFVTREEFERDIEQDRFLEYRELKGHFHGTSFSAIKMIMESGHVPVLDLHPQALKKIRHSGVRPYIVFVASPRLERLQLTRKVGTEKLKRRLISSPHHSSESESAHIYTESDLQHLVKESYLIENQYGHYFDWIIVNDDFQVAADMLKEVSRRLEVELQWVPYAWKNY